MAGPRKFSKTDWSAAYVCLAKLVPGSSSVNKDLIQVIEIKQNLQKILSYFRNYLKLFILYSHSTVIQDTNIKGEYRWHQEQNMTWIYSGHS